MKKKLLELDLNIIFNMVRFEKGNIFESGADALVNTVNTDGIMGKGIALQFKNAFPFNYNQYVSACKNKEIAPGKLLVVKDTNLLGGDVWIVNFPTKTSWRKPSEYKYIEEGLDDLKRRLTEMGIKTIALPPLGSGNGGLEWSKVKKIILEKLSDVEQEIIVFEPNSQIEEQMKKERVQLTEARAMLLYMLYQLQKNGEFVSEFSCEKICYFLQRFGAKPYFKLNFQANFYGPYSGKVRHVVNYLNGSYIMGFSSMDKKPFEPLSLVPDGEKAVEKFLDDNQTLMLIVRKTEQFLEGFYSDFALELLSSVDYITQQKKTFDPEEIRIELKNWSERKSQMFANNRFINIAIKHLKTANFSEGN